MHNTQFSTSLCVHYLTRKPTKCPNKLPFPNRTVTLVPNHCLHHTNDFLHSPKQFSVTINTGLASHVLIDRLWCSLTNQRSAGSTPSHIVISVTDLEVKFNFPLQSLPVNLEAISSVRHRKERII